MDVPKYVRKVSTMKKREFLKTDKKTRESKKVNRFLRFLIIIICVVTAVSLVGYYMSADENSDVSSITTPYVEN